MIHDIGIWKRHRSFRKAFLGARPVRAQKRVSLLKIETGPIPSHNHFHSLKPFLENLSYSNESGFHPEAVSSKWGALPISTFPCIYVVLDFQKRVRETHQSAKKKIELLRRRMGGAFHMGCPEFKLLLI